MRRKKLFLDNTPLPGHKFRLARAREHVRDLALVPHERPHVLEGPPVMEDPPAGRRAEEPCRDAGHRDSRLQPGIDLKGMPEGWARTRGFKEV